jgi:AAA+ superfamily predicted ATPase
MIDIGVHIYFLSNPNLLNTLPPTNFLAHKENTLYQEQTTSARSLSSYDDNSFIQINAAEILSLEETLSTQLFN